jgi:UDP-N-acetylmuramate dehydrogenase
MMNLKPDLPVKTLREAFGNALKENVRMAGFTTARTGGTADGMLTATSSDELAAFAGLLWKMEVPFKVLGSGSNVLISDQGYRGVVILNRARNFEIDIENTPASIRAESGANLGGIARQAALQGLSGLEWATTIPGSVGGAVYGNAGAHGGDVNGHLMLAEILHQITGREDWSCDRMQYGYRTSALKQQRQPAVILSARFALTQSTPEKVQAQMDEFSTHRRATQPPGASMGSMFKNPPGDYAGRLIELAGLKGTQIGGAEISSRHANFFVNHEEATALDIWKLIHHCQKAVMDKFGINLELEIELIGEWPETEEGMMRSTI